MPPKKNLIIGAACGYDLEYLRPFIHSYTLNCPEAECVFIIGTNASPDLLLALDNAGITTVQVDTSPPLLSRTMYRALIHLLPNSILDNMSRNNPKRIENALSAYMKISSARYFIYKRIVEESDWADCILLTDTRDVVFTGDIFESAHTLKKDTLKIALESDTVKIENERFTAQWIKKAYGQQRCEQLKHNRISCSGTTMGNREAILMYLSKMTSEMMRLKKRIRKGRGWDQGIHNVLLWQKELGTTQFSQTNSGDIATMGLEDKDACQFNPEDFTATWSNGTKINLIHQFDRHETLCQQIENATSSD